MDNGMTRSRLTSLALSLQYKILNTRYFKRSRKASLALSFVLVALVLVGAPAPGGSAESAAPVRVMSFNIRTLAIDDGRDFWTFRKKHVAALVDRHAPDAVGLQEAYPSQARDLEKLLPDYEWYGVPRDDGKKLGEMCAIFFRPDRLEPQERGTFWLSADPDKPGSRSWDSVCRRVVTWIKFKDLDTDKEFFHFNTHFDHMGVIARRESAKILIERRALIAGESPLVVTGDFNCAPDSDPYRIIVSEFEDARLVTLTEPEGPEGTSRAFFRMSRPGRRIDYAFVTPGVAVLSYAVLDDTYGRGRRPSDHMPVLVEIVAP